MWSLNLSVERWNIVKLLLGGMGDCFCFHFFFKSQRDETKIIKKKIKIKIHFHLSEKVSIFVSSLWKFHLCPQLKAICFFLFFFNVSIRFVIFRFVPVSFIFDIDLKGISNAFYISKYFGLLNRTVAQLKIVFPFDLKTKTTKLNFGRLNFLDIKLLSIR